MHRLSLAVSALVTMTVLAGCSVALGGHGTRADGSPATQDQLVSLLPTLVDMPDLSWRQSTDVSASLDSFDTDVARCTGRPDPVPNRAREVATHDIYSSSVNLSAYAYAYASSRSVTADLARVRDPDFVTCFNKQFVANSNPAIAASIGQSTVNTGRAGKAELTVVTLEVMTSFTGDDHARHVQHAAFAYVFGHQVDGELDLYDTDAPIPTALQATQVAKFADRIANIP